MDEKEIYLHGMILGSHSFLLKGGLPEPDGYSEIGEKYFLPGGETGTAATVLASLGAKVKIDGVHIGTDVAPMLKAFYDERGVDLSSLFFDPDYAGLMDYVLIYGIYRSPLGFFQKYFESGEKRWNAPKEDDIRNASVAGIDPFFMDESDEAARLCVKYGVPYVTIDSAHDSYLHQHAAVNAVSTEFVNNAYPGRDIDEVFELLKEASDGLTVITQGPNEMLYGRRGQKKKTLPAFKVSVKSTLGAGDTFKAGCIYALSKGMSDGELVRFAAACSAVAIQRFPLPLNPPTLKDVEALLSE